MAEEAVKLFQADAPLQYPLKRDKRSRIVAWNGFMFDSFLKGKRITMLLVETSDDPQNNKRYTVKKSSSNSTRSMHAPWKI